jgi:hypothetical protein
MLKNYIATLLTFVVFLPSVALAAPSLLSNTSNGGGSTNFSVTGTTSCLGTGDCQINDFLVLGIRLSNWILGIVGSLALAAFVYAGFWMLISQGDATRIKKGKDAMIAAVVGLVIVFSSYILIKFFMKTMGLDWNGTSSQPSISSQINTGGCPNGQVRDATSNTCVVYNP